MYYLHWAHGHWLPHPTTRNLIDRSNQTPMEASGAIADDPAYLLYFPSHLSCKASCNAGPTAEQTGLSAQIPFCQLIRTFLSNANVLDRWDLVQSV